MNDIRHISKQASVTFHWIEQLEKGGNLVGFCFAFFFLILTLILI